MRRFRGFTLVELLVVVGIIGLLAAILVPTLQQASEITKRTMCTSNLGAVGKGVQIYKGSNDNNWPWMKTKSDNDWKETATGENRDESPEEEGNEDLERAITALPFLLVRDGQQPKMFTCPSTDDQKDPAVFDDANTDEDEEPEYFWDFSSFRNISYSWQAPITPDGKTKYKNGISDMYSDAVIMADRTPDADAWTDWDPAEWKDPDDLHGADLEEHVGPNHRGKHISALFAGLYVDGFDRPDIGVAKDMIWTASGDTRRGDREATSVDLSDHHSARDSFLIGPTDPNE